MARPTWSRLPAPLKRGHVPKDLDTIETIGAEVDPTSVGLKAQDIEEIWSTVRRLYRWGMHPAIQLCLRRDGEVVLDRSLGYARGGGPGERRENERTLATPQTPFVLASGSKAVTAMVVHLLDDRGLLHVDDRVCEYVPEFGRNGKEAITINHVLSHRSGVPNIPREALDLDLITDHNHILQILADAKPTIPPGRFVAYHAVSGGFILAELVRRVTGKTINEVLQTEILDPLGFDLMSYGIAPERRHELATNHHTGLPVLPPLSTLFDRAFGYSIAEVTKVLDDPRFLDGIVPAANIVANANEFGRFFELLRQGGTMDGVRVFDPRTIRRAISEQSYMEFDFTLGVPTRYGMGFMLGAKYLSLYGPHTQYAFGHLGFTNIVGWADPERRLSGALLTSGKPIVGPHLYDFWDVMRTIHDVSPR
ncbi:MAG: CubicO group peptidase (beta-lactamase class C family), partial [Glaciecola sp.]